MALSIIEELERALVDVDKLKMFDELFGMASGRIRPVKSMESGVEELHSRFDLIERLINGEEGFETMAQAMVLKITDGEITPEKLKERWDLSLLDDRIALAFWLLPKGYNQAAQDFVERLGVTTSLTMSKWDPDRGQQKDVPEISMTMLGSKPPSRAMKDFRHIMKLIGLGDTKVSELITMAAKGAWDEFMRHGGVDATHEERHHIPLRMLGRFLEMRKEAAMGELDFSSTEDTPSEPPAAETDKDTEAGAPETKEPEKAPA